MAKITITNPLAPRIRQLESDVIDLQYIIKIAFTLGGQYHEPFPGEQGMALAQKKLRRLMTELPSLVDAIDDE